MTPYFSQSNIKLPLLALSLAASIFTGAANAAPTVSGVSGTLTNGQTVTIKGVGFGNGPHVLLFDDFEKGNGAVGGAIPLTSPEVGQWDKYGYANGRPRYHALANSGTHGWGIRDWNYIQYPTDDNNRQGQFRKAFGQNVTEMFITFQVAVPAGTPFAGASTPKTFPSPSSWKFAWVSDTENGILSSTGGDGHADMCLPSHVGGGSIWLAGNDGNLFGLGNSWWSWNGFNRIAVWMRANPSGPATLNGDVLFQAVNAEKGLTSIYKNVPAFPNSGATTIWNWLRMPGWWGNGDWSKFDGVYDDVYVAIGPNSAARIEIGDASTYAASKNLTILTPTSWTDTQISATVRAGSFKSFTGAYLYVTDSNGNVSKGIPLTALVPKAPTLTVQ
jgi:hypothetical protein